jgi:hypothetical protein
MGRDLQAEGQNGLCLKVGQVWEALYAVVSG